MAAITAATTVVDKSLLLRRSETVKAAGTAMEMEEASNIQRRARRRTKRRLRQRGLPLHRTHLLKRRLARRHPRLHGRLVTAEA
jgi:hypothetical protein